MPDNRTQMTDREVLAVFSLNLRELTAGVPSISALCQALQINRAQFNRYLSGQASPRPLVLRRICEHFGVDARILIEPLATMAQTNRDGMQRALDRIWRNAGTPVGPTVIADGLYAEWKLSLHRPGHVRFHVLQVRTQEGLRKTRVYTVDHLQPVLAGTRRTTKLLPSHGVLFKQGAGFGQLDTSAGSDILSMTAYRVGFSANSNIYPGIKLSGTSFVHNLSHCTAACVLVPLPREIPKLLRAIRNPRSQPLAKAPDYVRKVLLDTSRTGFISPLTEGWSEG